MFERIVAELSQGPDFDHALIGGAIVGVRGGGTGGGPEPDQRQAARGLTASQRGNLTCSRPIGSARGPTTRIGAPIADGAFDGKDRRAVPNGRDAATPSGAERRPPRSPRHGNA